MTPLFKNLELRKSRNREFHNSFKRKVNAFKSAILIPSRFGKMKAMLSPEISLFSATPVII